MALLVTLFLVLVNIFNAITTNSPKADGLNALQAWVIACIFFIFGKRWCGAAQLAGAAQLIESAPPNIDIDNICAVQRS